MDLSRNWIGRYVELPSLDELCDALTTVGLAVEGREERGDDVLLDVDVTTNRPDCMCHLGLAREVAVHRDLALQVPEVELHGDRRTGRRRGAGVDRGRRRVPPLRRPGGAG